MTQLVAAREADADLGFMARLLALCSLPSTNPKQWLQYVRRNGPYSLQMTATGSAKLPYGSIPRLRFSSGVALMTVTPLAGWTK